ncbi:MAG: hypothetical protein KDD82_30025 [Planctomycetes bacterium]|nr:hypothetical protein [Planctomycetota bacterium]
MDQPADEHDERDEGDPEGAESAPERPLSADEHEPLRVSPPQNFNPIFGTWGGGGYQVMSEVEVAPRDVLLEVRGSSTARLALLLCMTLGAPLLCLLPAAAEWVTREIPARFDVSPLAVIVAVGCTGLLVLGLLVASGASSLLSQGRAVFTEQGVLRDRPGGSLFVPWGEITGYRASAEAFVALLGEPGILVSVPTASDEDRGRVLEILDRRGVPRVS